MELTISYLQDIINREIEGIRNIPVDDSITKLDKLVSYQAPCKEVRGKCAFHDVI